MIDGIQTVRIVAVQRMKHRKRRINKKWEKKYGLRYDLYHGEDKIKQKDFKNGRITIEYQEVPTRCFSISDIINFHDHQKALAYLSQFVDKKFFDGIRGTK